MAAQAKAAGIRVILCSVTPEELLNTATTVSAVMIEEFNQQLIEIAQQNGYLYADYYDAMLTNGQFDPSLYVDGGHPNDVGYQIMWSVLEPLINEDLQ
jgi:lysophospholipase L1-like esterase